MTKVLVTGASGGIGRELCSYFLDNDNEYHVIGQYFKNLPPPPFHWGDRSYRYDLTQENKVQELIQTTHPDVLVHCVGTNKDSLSWKLSVEDWDSTMDVNLKSAWLLSKYLIPKMKENGYGRIIFISSILASMGVAGTAAYSASKAGLEGLTRALAAETTKYGITVNCIAPGYLDKGITERVPKEVLDKFAKRIPLGKLGPTSELCELVTYLMNASWCTGQVFHLDGGTLTLR
ncbi:MAG: SDR family oxidoreductase [Candidatus Thorarchaeota archaeon]|jgi:3-oxoacyl-[acyl-carrier protein] reductase